MTKQDKADLKLAIRARKEVLRRMDTPIRRLDEKVRREKTDRAVRRAALREYKTEDEVREAYGYEMITEEEMKQRIDELESDQEYIEETNTVNSEALLLLREFAARMQHDIQHFEFELLPEQAQFRILQERETRMAKARERREALFCESHS